MNQADALVKQGDVLAIKGEWSGAEVDYTKALQFVPKFQNALFPLARHAAQVGDVRAAIRLYRSGFYATDGKFLTGDTESTMHYALLLSEAGQMPEALAVYNGAARFVDYNGDGSRALRVLLPVYSDGLQPYSLAEFQSKANVGASLTCPDDVRKLQYLQSAVNLYHTGGIANHYMGEDLKTKPGSEPSALKAFRAAWEDGDRQVEAAVVQAVRSGTPAFVQSAKGIFPDH